MTLMIGVAMTMMMLAAEPAALRLDRETLPDGGIEFRLVTEAEAGTRGQYKLAIRDGSGNQSVQAGRFDSHGAAREIARVRSGPTAEARLVITLDPEAR